MKELNIIIRSEKLETVKKILDEKKILPIHFMIRRGRHIRLYAR